MEKLGLDVKLIIAQMINFTLFFWLFRKFMARPFVAFLTKEQERVAHNEALAKELETRKSELGQQQIELHRKATADAKEVMQQAKTEAVTIKTQLVREAQQEVEDLKANADKQLSMERQEMEQEVRAKLSHLAVTMVQKALTEYLTPEARREITQYIIKGNQAQKSHEN